MTIVNKKPKHSFMQRPLYVWKKCRATNKVLQQIKADLYEKGYSKESVDLLITKCSLIRGSIVEVAIFFIKKFSYKFRSNFDELTLDENKNYLVCANHYSHIDYLMLDSEFLRVSNQRYIPVFLASSHLNKGIIGFFFRGCNVAFISRSERNDSKLLNDYMAQLRRHHIPLLIFPEGGWSCNGNLKPFKPGTISMMARDSDVYIIPVKFQSTRTLGDLNYSFVRKHKKWNTTEGVIPIFEKIPEIFRFKGNYYSRAGQPFLCPKGVEDSVPKIKESIERLAVYATLEEESLSVIKRLFKGDKKQDILISKEFGQIFEWEKYSEEELFEILYFSCNQFIYNTIVQNHQLRETYENMIFREKDESIPSDDTFYAHIFKIIKLCQNI